MRFSVKFTIQGDSKKIPLRYRNMFLSIMKKVFENGDGNIYEKFYKEKEGIKPNVMKAFTFAIYIPNPKFEKDEIEIGDNFVTLNFSTADMESGIHFFNGLLRQEQKEFEYKGYKLKIAGINMVKEKVVTSKEVVFKTLSPVAIRIHDEKENRDEYIPFSTNNFSEEFEKSIKNRIEALTGLKRDIKVESVEMKKNVVKHNVGGDKEIFITANSGIFKVNADIDVLDLIYKAGVGSRVSEGFGMLEMM